MMLGEKHLFLHSVELFSNIQEVDKIILAVIPDMVEVFEKILSEYNFKNICCVEGGVTRQESVYNALKHCNSDRVILHVASRPFVSKEHIYKLMFVNAKVVVPYVKQIYSMVSNGKNYIDRDTVYNIQLPQIFDTKLLKAAHNLAKGKNYKEDSELVYKELGVFPTLIEGIEQNIKITTFFDVKMANFFYENRLKE